MVATVIVSGGGSVRTQVRSLYRVLNQFPAPPSRLRRWWQRMTTKAQVRLAWAVQDRCLVGLIDALEDGARPNQAIFDDGATALHAACRDGWLGGIEALLAAGADASFRSADGVSVALRAAPHGMALVNRLLQAGASLGENGADIDAIQAKLPYDGARGGCAWKPWAQDRLLERAMPTDVAVSTRTRL